MYYGVLCICAIMFAAQFFFTDMFRENYGDDIRAMLVSSVGSGFVGAVVLSLLNGFHFGYTPFSLIMAVLTVLNLFGVSYCSLKVLGKVNLSVYSLFMMLGGMVLPFLAGILCFHEEVTPQKWICLILIALSLLIVIRKDSKQKTGSILYYIGIFILNGMSGVLTKIYQACPFEKISASEFSVLCAVLTLLFSLIGLFCVKGERRRLNRKAFLAVCGSGILNRLANYLLLWALFFLPASVQYPFITGGTIIFSTVFGFFTAHKPKMREMLSVAVAFGGLIVLCFS